MPNYKIAQPVDWRRVLNCVRRCIEADTCFFEKRLNINSINCTNGKEYICREMQQKLKAYEALRKFLGYSASTKLEKETAELLKALLYTEDTKKSGSFRKDR